MRTNKLAIAAVLAAAALSANAAGPRMEGDHSPFTYEAVGATPSLAFGRARSAAAAAVEATRAPVAKSTDRRDAPPRAAGTSSTFTYEALGATPHVETRKSTRTEALAQPAR